MVRFKEIEKLFSELHPQERERLILTPKEKELLYEGSKKAWEELTPEERYKIKQILKYLLRERKIVDLYIATVPVELGTMAFLGELQAPIFMLGIPLLPVIIATTIQDASISPELLKFKRLLEKHIGEPFHKFEHAIKSISHKFKHKLEQII